MNPERDAIRAAIRAEVLRLAAALGMDAAGIDDDDIIPATGLLDSTAILELVVWYERTYALTLAQEEVNIDNLGSINAMTDFLIARKAAG